MDEPSGTVDHTRSGHLEAQRARSLYAQLQPQLVRILSSNLQPPEWVIDDACQTAWSSLLQHRDAVARGGELSWLSTTATRAALRLMRRDQHVECCEELPEPVRLQDRRAVAPDPERNLELLDRLAEVRRLPVRERRALVLHGLGYEYDEIAAATGDTRRTVARQLTRARQRLLRAAQDDPMAG